MARPRARASHPHPALAAAAVASVAVIGMTACGGAPDRTEVGATAMPAASAIAPGPDATCGDGVFTEGDDKGQIPEGFLRPGFALPRALDGFDVLCTISWTMLMNDCEMQFSRAFIAGGADGDRRREIDDALIAWSTAHGLAQTEIGMFDNSRSYGIDVNPDDGGVMTLLQWDAVSRYEGAEAVQRHADEAGIPLDGGDVRVMWQVCPALQGWETPPS